MLRVLFATALSLLTSNAAATPQNQVGDYSKNSLISLHFYPPAEQFQPKVARQSSLANSTRSQREGSATQSTKQTATQVSVAMSYGITDGLWGGLSDVYLLNSTKETANHDSNLTKTTKSNGPSDPVMALNWRFLSNPEADLFGNLAFSYSPISGGHKTATDTRDGDNLNGYSESKLSAFLYWVKGIHEFGLGLSALYDSDGATVAGGTNSSHRKAQTKASLLPRYRWHAAAAFFMQTGGNLTSSTIGTQISPDRRPPTTETTDTPAHFIPDLMLGYQPKADVLVSADWVYNHHHSTTKYGNASPSRSTQSLDSQLVVEWTCLF